MVRPWGNPGCGAVVPGLPLSSQFLSVKCTQFHTSFPGKPLQMDGESWLRLFGRCCGCGHCDSGSGLRSRQAVRSARLNTSDLRENTHETVPRLLSCPCCPSAHVVLAGPQGTHRARGHLFLNKLRLSLWSVEAALLCFVVEGQLLHLYLVSERQDDFRHI